MPLFDYQCTTCPKKIEDVMEPWVENPAPRVCPECGSPSIRKDFYQTWFNFLAEGFGTSSANCNNYKV